MLEWRHIVSDKVKGLISFRTTSYLKTIEISIESYKRHGLDCPGASFFAKHFARGCEKDSNRDKKEV